MSILGWVQPTLAIEPGHGNIYFVMQTGNDNYSDFVRRHKYYYKNSAVTSSVYTDIQSAVSACVADRNDYVIVMPDSDDYDLTTTVTVSTKSTHVICPAGLGTSGIGMNAARVDCTADVPAFTITGDCIEIAGFFIKGYSNGGSCILLSGTRWHANIHDNFVGIKSTSAGVGYGIYGAGACSHMSIHRNYITQYGPGAMTGADNVISGAIAFTSASCTRNVITDNIITTGANTTMAVGILDAGDQSMILRNYIFECPAFGGVYDASTLTLGISSGTTSFVADNRIGIVTAANAVSGGTADSSYCCTYEASAGATAAT